MLSSLTEIHFSYDIQTQTKLYRFEKEIQKFLHKFNTVAPDSLDMFASGLKWWLDPQRDTLLSLKMKTNYLKYFLIFILERLIHYKLMGTLQW